MMRRIRTSLFRRRPRQPASQTNPNPEAQSLLVHSRASSQDEDQQPATDVAPWRPEATATAAQPESPSYPSDREARIFALRHLSNALTTLERGILRLEHKGQYIETFDVRKLWQALLTDYVKKDEDDGVEYESALKDFQGGETHQQQVDRALEELGMGLVLAEATMGRWEWVPPVKDLRREVAAVYARFGRRLPDGGS